jgi:hypothetical protein
MATTAGAGSAWGAGKFTQLTANTDDATAAAGSGLFM